MMRTAAFGVVLWSILTLSFAPSTERDYENLNAILWVQTSVEYQASTVQTYRLAAEALVKGLHDQHWTAALEQTGDFENLPPAVILDLDETVLDNSAFEASLMLSGEHYSDAAWTKWMNEKRPGLVPGAMDFLQFAHSHGVAPLYITDRVCDSANESDSTVQVLRSFGVPLDPVEGRLFCSKDGRDHDKTERRRLCAGKFRILLLLGDQLGDFLQIPKGSTDLRSRETLFVAHQSLWGERWFQLPNPMYGSWEGAVGYGTPEKLSKLRQ